MRNSRLISSLIILAGFSFSLAQAKTADRKLASSKPECSTLQRAAYEEEKEAEKEYKVQSCKAVENGVDGPAQTSGSTVTYRVQVNCGSNSYAYDVESYLIGTPEHLKCFVSTNVAGSFTAH